MDIIRNMIERFRKEPYVPSQAQGDTPVDIITGFLRDEGYVPRINEDGILFWILGNDNASQFTDSAESTREDQAKTYYMFVNEVAQAVKEADPDHPMYIQTVYGVGYRLSKDLK